MARNRYRVSMDATYTAAVDGAYHTVLQGVAISTARFALLDFWISFRGVTATSEPVLVELIRTSSTAGTQIAVPSTHIERLSPDSGTPTIKSTFGRSFTTEDATLGQRLWVDFVHPQSKFIWPLGHQVPIMVPESGRISLRVQFTAAQIATACLAGFTIEE